MGKYNVLLNADDNYPERYTIAIRWTLVGRQKQKTMEQGKPEYSLPIVLLAESHLRCVGVRITHEITVYDEVALGAQIAMGQELLKNAALQN